MSKIGFRLVQELNALAVALEGVDDTRLESSLQRAAISRLATRVDAKTHAVAAARDAAKNATRERDNAIAAGLAIVDRVIAGVMSHRGKESLEYQAVRVVRVGRPTKKRRKAPAVDGAQSGGMPPNEATR